MKKSSQFNPQKITDIFFPDAKPEDINQGHCWVWAYLAFKTFKGVELWDTNYHAFIRYRGKFYDCERPQGVKDWYELPACRSFSKEEQGPSTKRRVGEFQKRWKPSVELYNIHWNELDQKLLQIKGRK